MCGTIFSCEAAGSLTKANKKRSMQRRRDELADLCLEVHERCFLSLSEEGLMGVARHAQFGAAKMGEVLLGVEAHMHRGKMYVAPGPLDGVRSCKGGSAAHRHDRVNGTDA